MASEKLFANIPPFPGDIPTAPMHTISLAGLRSGNENVAKEVLDACKTMGFFLLDLRGDTLGESLTREIDQIFEVGQEIMSLPENVKEKFSHDPPRSFLGFKPRGVSKTETGEDDRYEFFNIGQDGLLGNTPLQPVPPLVHGNLPLFTSFLEHGRSIVQSINENLATQLSLPVDTFTSLQPQTKPSGTMVRLVKVEASVKEEDLRTALVHHTDYGTVTLLANVLGGLQILKPGKSLEDQDAWLWVRPQPGCLIVNLGDAMVQWTGGLLRSNIHRINYPPGQQRFADRFSLAILVRPERNASMRRLVGEDDEDEDGDANLTAWEWEVKKAMAMKRGDNVVTQHKGSKLPVA